MYESDTYKMLLIFLFCLSNLNASNQTIDKMIFAAALFQGRFEVCNLQSDIEKFALC